MRKNIFGLLIAISLVCVPVRVEAQSRLVYLPAIFSWGNSQVCDFILEPDGNIYLHIYKTKEQAGFAYLSVVTSDTDTDNPFIYDVAPKKVLIGRIDSQDWGWSGFGYNKVLQPDGSFKLFARCDRIYTR